MAETDPNTNTQLKHGPVKKADIFNFNFFNRKPYILLFVQYVVLTRRPVAGKETVDHLDCKCEIFLTF